MYLQYIHIQSQYMPGPKNQKIYVLPKIKVKHQGGMSVNLNNKLSIEANKHWHYMWSKFYYHKKHF